MGERRGHALSTPRLRLARSTGTAVESQDSGLDVAARLAAELGHDLNNELAATLNYSFLLAREVEHDPVLKEHLDGLQAAAWRATHLAQALRLFAPRQTGRGDALDVNAVVGALVPMLERLSTGYRLELHLDPRLPRPCGVRAELEQILLGLVLHARDSLALGGSIALATSAHGSADARTVRVTCVRRNPPERARSGEMSRVVTSRPALPWAPFRRALRALDARLSHDASAVHVDLPVVPGAPPIPLR